MADAASKASAGRPYRPKFQHLAKEKPTKVPPDGSESSTSESSVNLQAIHAQHVANADDIDWEAHPRLERVMRKLFTRLADTTETLEDMKEKLSKAKSTGGPNTLHAQLYADQVVKLSADRRRMQQEVAAIMTLADPDVTGTILDRVKSEDTREAENDFNTVWKDYQRTQKASWAKYGWTLASGTCAYAIPFGTGTMLSRGLGIPWLVAPVAGAMHTLFEPFWTAIRSVTWTNPSAEGALQRQRVRARDVGDMFRQCAGMEPKLKFIIPDPDGGEPEVVSAHEFLRRGNDWAEWAEKHGCSPEADRCGFLNWIDKVAWVQWADKMLTDDMPFFVFTVFYSAKNSVVEFMGMDFYNQLGPERPMYNDTQHNIWVIPPNPVYNGKVTGADLGLQFVAGMLSGAFAMLISQGLRRWLASRTNGREVVTKSLHVWELEARFLRSYIDDIDKELNKNKTATPRSKYLHKDKYLLEQKRKELVTQLATAQAKTGILSGFWYDLNVMWQGKRRAVATGPDISGKRLDTLCSMAGRITSLACGVGISYLAAPYQRLTGARIDPVGRVLRHIAQPLALVAWPGFNSRLEWQGAYRVAFGALKGMYSAMAACCCAAEDDDDAYDDDDEGAEDHVTTVPRTTARRNLFPGENGQPSNSSDSRATDSPFNDTHHDERTRMVKSASRAANPSRLIDADDSES
ncbi:hypothetical protein [Noviherbaspirillum pedocola]|uniref:Uncharacterized protein n=1 Tax=Noviherbaspirillum pedocola TaxID=2801341 RepID=A0A934SYW1_9BURK|nr:hypothetical protein [Noviherbaspirillum pedocola]MBK4738247.1 hypothetical protein [Noviherbaspirillum pedocola]